jgi:hypothetical protein
MYTLDHWEDPGVDGRIILKWGLERLDGSKEVSNFSEQYCILTIHTHFLELEFAVLLCLCVCLPDADNSEVETCRMT